MDLIFPKTIKELLKKHGATASKRLGQNFLVNKGVINKVVSAAELSPDDIVLEIGPGLGALTRELAKKAKRVVAIEKDPKMCEILKELLEGWNVKNVEIIQGDILKLNTKYKIQNTKYKVVANLPFYLTAPVIRQFLENKNPREENKFSSCPFANAWEPEEMALVVQKEVAQRICAKAPDMNLLAVSVQFYAEPRIIDYISKKSFWPQPKVDAAIIKIAPFGIKTYDRRFLAREKNRGRDLFFRIVKAGFSQPRKQLINNLSQGLKTERGKIESWLLKNNIRPQQRAETLTVADWINLLKSCTIL